MIRAKKEPKPPRERLLKALAGAPAPTDPTDVLVLVGTPKRTRNCDWRHAATMTSEQFRDATEFLGPVEWCRTIVAASAAVEAAAHNRSLADRRLANYRYETTRGYTDGDAALEAHQRDTLKATADAADARYRSVVAELRELRARCDHLPRHLGVDAAHGVAYVQANDPALRLV